MATADDYAAWIVKNADKKGTPEFETVAQAYQLAKRPKVPIVDNLNAETLDPTKGMSTFEKVRAGIGQGMQSVWDGVTFTNKADVDARKKTDEALLNTGAGTVGSVIGNMAAAAPAAFIPGANTVLGAGAIGAGVGALTTPGDMSDRATGAAFGGVGGAAGQAIPRALKVAKAAAEPLSEGGRNAIVGRVMNRAAGENAPDVVNRLRMAQALVPGSAPTAAEVAESGGMAALQRAMAQADPEAYAHRGAQQASARINAIRGIAGDEGQREMFAAARSATADDLYKQAYKAGVDLRRDAATGQFLTKAQQAGRKGEISKLMDTPAMQEAAERAQKLMRNDPNLKGQVLNPSGSVQGLDYTRRALSDMIGDAKGNEQRILINLRERLDTTLDAISPKYGEARRQFQAMSEPINQMDVGKALLDKLQPALSDHGALASETGAKFAAALRNEGESVARSATGMRKGLADVLSPEQMDSVKAVAADLARKKNAQDLGRGPGSNTFQNFAMDNLSQQMGMPSAVKQGLGWIPGLSPTAQLVAKGAGAAGRAAYSRADDAIRQAMAQALLNPQEAAALMSAASKPQGLAKMLAALPPARAEKLLPVLQAIPGVAGAAALPAYLEK